MVGLVRLTPEFSSERRFENRRIGPCQPLILPDRRKPPLAIRRHRDVLVIVTLFLTEDVRQEFVEASLTTTPVEFPNVSGFFEPLQTVNHQTLSARRSQRNLPLPDRGYVALPAATGKDGINADVPVL
jgi:hypothetical protein